MNFDIDELICAVSAAAEPFWKLCGEQPVPDLSEVRSFFNFIA